MMFHNTFLVEMVVLFLLNYSLMLPKMGMVLMTDEGKNHSIWEKLLIGD